MEKNKIDYNVQVTMVELDKTVMEVVREHMPSVAGGALDCKGERSKVFDTIFKSIFATFQHLRSKVLDTIFSKSIFATF